MLSLQVCFLKSYMDASYHFLARALPFRHEDIPAVSSFTLYAGQLSSGYMGSLIAGS